ncbi:MAG: acyl-CoA--6-aminopenicillanic acid acyl-transferase [Bacteroidaceae bacterium]|nr:acyl-CoA--6-aminopenicillanic acid acyl-transferase [Bacteroidaceae bacterium]
MNGKKVFLTLLLATLGIVGTEACTSVLVSGRFTKDGRPLLLKNRDTGNLLNHVLIVQGERYQYLAIVADGDTLPYAAWAGHNEAGFAIINTAAYNLNGKPQQDSRNGDEAALRSQQEGQRSRRPRRLNDGAIMRRALEICATLEDFEHFLDTLTNAEGDSNFGVVDAKGGAAYYEVGNRTDNDKSQLRYVKFDANDPRVAPYGYIVRTNHGYSGNREQDKGVERYLAISEYMQPRGFTQDYDARTFITQIPRTLRHGLTHLDVHDFAPEDETEAVFFPFRDFIPRYQTSCTVLVQGVREGEDPRLTVSWTIVGNPLTTVAVPLLLTPHGSLPELLGRHDGKGSLLNHWGLELKKRLFPVTRGNGIDYINVAALLNKAGTGILQRILPVEKGVLDRGDEVLAKLRTAGRLDVKEVDTYYKWVDEELRRQYHELFGF